MSLKVFSSISGILTLPESGRDSTIPPQNMASKTGLALAATRNALCARTHATVLPSGEHHTKSRSPACNDDAWNDDGINSLVSVLEPCRKVKPRL